MLDISTDHFNAFAPAFRLLSAATSKEHPDEYLWVYVEYFTVQHLMPEAVNQTARDIVLTWNDPYWPSPEYIAKRAHQKTRSVMDEIHGVHTGSRALEDWCESEAQRRWDSRLAEANTWREREGNMERFKLLVRDIDKDIAVMIQSGLHPFMRDEKVYRQHFREGSAVGACLRKAGQDAHKLAKQQEIARLAAVQIAMREDSQSQVLTSAT